MQDYELSVLEQYNIDVNGTRKTRGAILCDTRQGLLLLRSITMSEKKIPALCELYEYMQEQGYTQMDMPIKNKDGEYISTAEDASKYMLKRWFVGRECDVRKTSELLDASGNLAKLHNILRCDLEHGAAAGGHLKETYLRHNRELKKVRKFMRGLSPKGEFEMLFLKNFDSMYQWADTAILALDESGYDNLYSQSIEQNCMTHGEYNYHNILIVQQEMATTNFERFRKDVQVEDLYYFLRKVMEKHGWKEQLGDHMINAYSAIHPLSSEETEYLKLRLIYPEKFWKIANSYYCSNKAWISVKSIEKLNAVIRQTEEKRRFLENIFSFHL